MKQYYAQRAHEYDLIYQKPERQSSLRKMEETLPKLCKDQRVLEIACGTGYWTQFIAESSQSVVATDINKSVLEIAKNRIYAKQNVSFQQVDFNQLLPPLKKYDIIFGGFIWSHIPKQEIEAYLKKLKSHLSPKGKFIFIDNRFVKGSSTPISRTDQHTNTYQIRHLQDGSTFEVIKNFPTESEVALKLPNGSTNFNWQSFEYYWLASWNTT